MRTAITLARSSFSAKMLLQPRENTNSEHGASRRRLDGGRRRERPRQRAESKRGRSGMPRSTEYSAPFVASVPDASARADAVRCAFADAAAFDFGVNNKSQNALIQPLQTRNKAIDMFSIRSGTLFSTPYIVSFDLLFLKIICIAINSRVTKFICL